MAGQIKLQTSAGGGVVLDTATTTATDVTVKVPVTGVNNGTLVCSDSSGNVGIGTSSPAQKLDVTASGLCAAKFTRSGGASGYIVNSNSTSTYFSSDTSGNTSWGADSGSNYVLAYTNGSERMRIDSSGNLLVGTTSNIGAGGLTVAPNASVGAPCIFWNRANSTGTSYVADFRNNNSNVGYISYTNTATTYSTSSDYRLKENVQPMQNALAVVQQLNPVTYTWKADGSDGQGFIAHELQAVVPDCVTGEKDAVDAEGNPVYQGIDTSFLSATLTKAIQELSAKNDALEARIAALESK